MITNFRINNCFVFSEPVDFTMLADMRIKKLISNVHKCGDYNVLKSIGFYGPNNSGKTCLQRSIVMMRNIILKKRFNLTSNYFTQNHVCTLGMDFLVDCKKYSYDFKYDERKHEFIYEKFSEISIDKYKNELSNNIFVKDSENDIYESNDRKLQDALPIASKSNPLIHSLDTEKFDYLNQVKKLLENIASRIEFVDMNNISMKHTINMLKHQDQNTDKLIDFIKNADVALDNVYYADDEEFMRLIGNNKSIQEDIEKYDDFRLMSEYKGVKIPSMLADSEGTKKIAALASYIIESIEQGKILLIDEIDSSFHFSLSRAIVALFNNDVNSNSQLFFNTHDISLLDTKRLMRKEQIWFVEKNDKTTRLYSLKDFTANNDGIRDNSDIEEKYKMGQFGALPEPDLITHLLEDNYE